MSTEEIEQIVEATAVPFALHKDVAQRFRVAPILVSRLVLESKRKPEKLEAQRQKERTESRQKDAIEEVATKMLASNRPITSAKLVRDAVQSSMDIKVADDQVRHVMRKEMRLGYR